MTLVDPRGDLAGAAIVAIKAMRKLCEDETVLDEGSGMKVKAANVLLTAWARVQEAEEMGRAVPPQALPRAERVAQLRAALESPDEELTEAMRLAGVGGRRDG